MITHVGEEDQTAMPHFYSFEEDPRLRLARLWYAHLRCRDLDPDDPRFQCERNLIGKDLGLLLDEFCSCIPFDCYVPNVIEHGTPPDEDGCAFFEYLPSLELTGLELEGRIKGVLHKIYLDALAKIGNRGDGFDLCINFVAWGIHKKGYPFTTPINEYFDQRLPAITKARRVPRHGQQERPQIVKEQDKLKPPSWRVTDVSKHFSVPRATLQHHKLVIFREGRADQDSSDHEWYVEPEKFFRWLSGWKPRNQNSQKKKKCFQALLTDRALREKKT